ncbi:MAG: LuxR C-terminal-related transcriptional regulator, partial [Francisellaceae bacterium]
GRLNLSLYTVETHVRNIRNKLNATNTAHAVSIGYESGILPVWRTEDRKVCLLLNTKNIEISSIPVRKKSTQNHEEKI